MSLRNQIAWGFFIVGVLGICFGIMLISAYNGAGASGDLTVGSWMLGLGLAGAFSSVLIGNLSSTRIESSNQESDSHDC